MYVKTDILQLINTCHVIQTPYSSAVLMKLEKRILKFV